MYELSSFDLQMYTEVALIQTSMSNVKPERCTVASPMIKRVPVTKIFVTPEHVQQWRPWQRLFLS